MFEFNYLVVLESRCGKKKFEFFKVPNGQQTGAKYM